jgi:hypothetical protein
MVTARPFDDEQPVHQGRDGRAGDSADAPAVLEGTDQHQLRTAKGERRKAKCSSELDGFNVFLGWAYGRFAKAGLLSRSTAHSQVIFWSGDGGFQARREALALGGEGDPNRDPENNPATIGGPGRSTKKQAGRCKHQRAAEESAPSSARSVTKVPGHQCDAGRRH